jgi:DNA gyrase subunit A
VIKIIRSSHTTQDAKNGLMERFGLSDRQAQAIVDMRLRALTGLAREDIENEYAELQKTIAYLKEILADEKKLLGVIREEILVISEKYGDDRRTSIGYDEEEITLEDLIPHENTVIAMTKLGYIKRMTVDNFKSQNRGGKGIKGMQTINDDYIVELLMTTTHHHLMFVTNKGKAYRIKAFEIPDASRTSRGVAIINLIQMEPGEKVTAMFPIKDFSDNQFLLMVTKNGIVKKTPLAEYNNIRKRGLQAIALREDDELIEVKKADNSDIAMLVTKYGQCIKFKVSDIRRTGRNSIGVRGINLDAHDEVIGMQLESQGDALLFVTENGLGKRTLTSEFSVQHRGGKGVKCYRINDKTGNIVGVKAVNEENEIMLITTEGIIIQMQVKGISVLSRITSGVKLIDIDKEDVVVASIAKVRETPEESKDNENVEDIPDTDTEEEDS